MFSHHFVISGMSLEESIQMMNELISQVASDVNRMKSLMLYFYAFIGELDAN